MFVAQKEECGEIERGEGELLWGQLSFSRGPSCWLRLGLRLALDWPLQLSLMSALGRCRRIGRVAADAVGKMAQASFGVAQFGGRNRLLQATLVEEGGVGLEVGDSTIVVDLRGGAVAGAHANGDAVQILPAAVGEQLQDVVDALTVVPGVVDAQHGAAVDGGVQEALEQGPGAAGIRRAGGRTVGVGAHVVLDPRFE